jgi:hypothetical protein
LKNSAIVDRPLSQLLKSLHPITEKNVSNTSNIVHEIFVEGLPIAGLPPPAGPSAAAGGVPASGTYGGEGQH